MFLGFLFCIEIDDFIAIDFTNLTSKMEFNTGLLQCLAQSSGDFTIYGGQTFAKKLHDIYLKAKVTEHRCHL